ncbi:bacterial membrane flanked domain protein [Clostridium acetireducens DSM 10703]|uniref:Bacterial membrane flanked domain protein n=1 Tax=Clostridium acetireducens DSM 10703 TaxID=1121290 RepID=A0A1E8F1M2_9CLOT|nr:PH domain-containing protein [Clostridium acetireducens]OFI07541.1 bacterial membrane flanked domain protein [Clostridium acetireducens DSM 10703]
MEYNKLNEKAKTSWMLARAVTTIIVAVILGVCKWFFTYKLKIDFFIKLGGYINVIFIIIVGLLLLNTFIYPAIEYAQWKYRITKDKIEFSEGIYSITTTIIPIVRVQHIKIHQGPINKIFNLANLSIYTAGGNHDIPNIDMKKAEEISEFLKDKIREKVEDYDKSN